MEESRTRREARFLHMGMSMSDRTAEKRKYAVGRPVPARGGSLGPPPFPISRNAHERSLTLLHTTSVPSQKDAREEAKEHIPSDPSRPLSAFACGRAVA